MNEQLLMGLLEEYKRMLIAEKEYLESERRKQFSELVTNVEESKNRPTKAEINRVGLMIRQETIKCEKDFDRSYLGLR